MPRVVAGATVLQEGAAAQFPTLSDVVGADEARRDKALTRRVAVPQNRLTPLKAAWMEIVSVLVEKMKLKVRYNTKRKQVELQPQAAADRAALERGAEYVRAYLLGFELKDAVALLRLHDVQIDSFRVKDVKNLSGDHLGRCIGRIAGKEGKTKLNIETTTKTRIVLQEDRIHVMGTVPYIRLAKNAISSLIMGSSANKVTGPLSTASKRMSEQL